MKALLITMLMLSSTASAYDYFETQEQRDFDTYRIQEQQRWRYEQDREDRFERNYQNQQRQYDWNRRLEESRERYGVE